MIVSADGYSSFYLFLLHSPKPSFLAQNQYVTHNLYFVLFSRCPRRIVHIDEGQSRGCLPDRDIRLGVEIVRTLLSFGKCQHPSIFVGRL